ncbi:MAG TPA: hypothetical protein VFB73_15995 [Chloroflexota bacterium]|nr:hypothetical protein [Chloroflexota bacterium]
MVATQHALYLANVGNRDVYLDGQPLPADQARALGEQIRNQYEAYRDRITAPIIEAGLEHVLARGKPERRVLVTVYLFATNQDASAGPHRARDTVHLAEVLCRYLKERFPPAKEPRGHVEDVCCVEIRQNPSYYDGMYEFFGERLRAARLAPERWDACYVSPVGGVPAANFALLLRAVERYAEKCHPLYVPEGSRHVVPSDIGDQLRRGLLRAQVRQQVAYGEFGRAAALLRELGADTALVGLAAHGQYRLHFDFDTAIRVLEDEVLRKARGELREQARRLRADLDGLVQRDARALIRELYHNLCLTYKAGRYVDFLLRLFRLQEAVLRWVVEHELGLPTDATNGKAHPAFVERIEANPALHAHMQQPYKGRVLDYRRPPTLAVLRHLLDYLCCHGDEAARARFSAVAALLDQLEELADLRNRSIGAHGFEGVSEAAIRQCYGADRDLLDDLRTLLEQLGLAPEDDPFAQLRELLLARLEEEA